MDYGLTQTHRQGFAPGPIGLTHRGLVAFDGHVGVTPEDDGGPQSSALVDVLQPAVGEVPGVTAVDL